MNRYGEFKVEEENSNYNSLIFSWYKKATAEDYFSKFIFLDLAFVALLRKKYFVNSKFDGDAIKSLKKADKIKQVYFEFIKKNREIEAIFEKLIQELNREPLKNISRNNETLERLSIKDKEDWENLIHFIYTVRNNLFHGEKNPEEFRDLNMVYYAYELLKPLVEILISYHSNDLDIEDYNLRKMKEVIKNGI